MKSSKLKIIALVFLTLSQVSFAQDQTVDASKPTNLYTQLNAAFEYQSSKKGDNLYGTRMKGAVLCNTTMPDGSVIYSGC